MENKVQRTTDKMGREIHYTTDIRACTIKILDIYLGKGRWSEADRNYITKKMQILVSNLIPNKKIDEFTKFDLYDLAHDVLGKDYIYEDSRYGLYHFIGMKISEMEE